MKTPVLATLCAAVVALAACDTMSTDERIIAGGLAGATLGVLTASALEADDEWVILAGLGGAAVGALVAKNDAKDECAYKRRDGTFVIRRCP